LDSNEVKVAFPQPTEVLTGFGFKFSPGGSHISRTMMLHELEQYAPALVDAIEAIEEHLRVLGFEPNRLIGAKGFTRIEALHAAVDALYTTDEAKRCFEIMARELFARMKTLILNPQSSRTTSVTTTSKRFTKNCRNGETRPMSPRL
jgi:hypothetical protein